MFDERVCIFVDGENLFYSQRRQGIEIDYLKLKETLVERRRLVRPYYYGTSTSEPRQVRFFNLLRLAGYEVRVLPLVEHDGKKSEKGVDVMLVTDMLVLAHRDVYDVAVLVAGDGDYVYAVRALKEMGKRVEVAFFHDSCSRELRLSADRIVSLTQVGARTQLHSRRARVTAGREVTGGEGQEAAAFDTGSPTQLNYR
nr:NYN domain-containing protein [Candidatus Njordarchaeota archaeon]